MEKSVSVVNLNCLNCGAKLKITDNIFEFACQYCGATQMVEREGGIVALKFLSDKIDRVQSLVERTSAEIKIQRLAGELREIEKKHADLEEVTWQLTSFVHRLALPMFSLVIFVFFVAAVLSGSVLPVVLGGIVAFLVFFAWRWKISRINEEYESAARLMNERKLEITGKMSELEKISKL